MAKYAKDTEVPIERSKAELERILQRYGASAYMYGWESGRAVIGFEIKNRRYRIALPLPSRSDSAFTFTETGRRRTSQAAVDEAYEQACRQRWRALALWVKATLEAAEDGIVTLETVLSPFIVLPNGSTVGDWLAPQIERAYQGGLPPMLPGAGGSSGDYREVVGSMSPSEYRRLNTNQPWDPADAQEGEIKSES